MRSVTVSAAAKLNLTFDITGTRPDGYHDVETLFQSVDLEDELRFELSESSRTEVEILCETPYVARMMSLDETNLIARAARSFIEAAGVRHHSIRVFLEKLIPIGAGLAGGSADAAATLFALNRIFDNVLSDEELREIAARLGADVPFCLRGGTCVGTERGDRLEPVASKLKMVFCIVKPARLSISTPWAYSAFDSFGGSIERPKLEMVRKGIETADIELVIGGLGNVFEPVVFAEHPRLEQLRRDILSQGAWACRMTGSGPTLFAIVPNRQMAHHIRRQILNDDELGFFYGTDEVMIEGMPPIDFRIAESCDYGVRIKGS